MAVNLKLAMNIADVAKNLNNIEIKATNAKKRVLTRQGFFVRKVATNSIRRRKKSSKAPDPPRHHATDRNSSLKNIKFSVEFSKGRVIIGPVKFNKASSTSRTRQTVPELQEDGGTVSVLQVSRDEGKTWRTVSRRIRRNPEMQTRRKVAKYEGRRFMAKAVSNNLDTLLEMWKGVIK